MARPEPLTDEHVLEIISKALGPAGHSLPSRHFRQRMRERNFDMNDALKVLVESKNVKPVWNEKSRSWNYDLAGRDIEGEELTIRIAITEDQRGVILVTGF